LVSQIEVLNELLYTVTNEAIIEEIHNKITEFEGEIADAEAIIESAQVAFNAIAEETILVVSKRQEELAEIEKQNRFNDAKSHYNNLQAEISDYQNRLQYFEEDQAAADDTKEKVRPCEPALLYELDASGIPQISQEAVDIIDAIASGIINPETFTPATQLPSNIETKPTELMKLFQLTGPPPGFEDIQLPIPGSDQQVEEEKFGIEEDFNNFDETTMPGYEDPAAISYTDGSLQQELAWAMQQATDDVRARVGQSIEQIMLDVVSHGPDGLGPCTTVSCLLTASMEAARIFIFEKQMQ
jgi:hypothetical protein